MKSKGENAVTQQIGVRELKNRLTEIIREIKETGVEYTVTVHGQPVANIRPLPASSDLPHAVVVQRELADLELLAAKLSSGSDAQPLRTALETMREETSWR